MGINNIRDLDLDLSIQIKIFKKICLRMGAGWSHAEALVYSLTGFAFLPGGAIPAFLARSLSALRRSSL